jgi:hypothetical protein
MFHKLHQMQFSFNAKQQRQCGYKRNNEERWRNHHHHHHHHHHHKYPGLGHLARSVSRVTVALSIVSSVS